MSKDINRPLQDFRKTANLK
jgi:hypothetical protein